MSGNRGRDEQRPLLSPASQTETDGERIWALGVVGLAGFVSSCSFWTYYVQWHDMLLLLGMPDTIESFSSDLLRFCAVTLGVLFASVYSATHGKTRILARLLLVQTVGSVLIGSSRSIQWLLLGQTVQYLGIAPVWSTGLGIVGEHFDGGMRGKAVGIYLSASMAGAAVSPFLCLLFRRNIAPILSVSSYEAWRLTEGLIGTLSLGCWLLVRRLPPSDTVELSPYPTPGNSLAGSPTIGNSNGHSGNGYHSTSSISQRTGSPEAVRHENGGSMSPNQVEDALSQAHARSMNPFAPLSLLRLRNVVALSFASGSFMHSGLALVWMEVSQFGWSLHLGVAAEKMTFRRFLPIGMLGIGAGSLISGILVDYLASRSLNRPSPERRLFISSLGTLLLPIGLSIVGFTLKFALDMDPFKGYDTMNDEMNAGGKVNVPLLLGGIFMSGFGAYSPVVPCITYFLGLVPNERNVQILAASDALQLLASLPLLLLYMIFAQGLGTGIANVIAAGGALYAFGLLWKVSRRSNGLHRHESGSRDE